MKRFALLALALAIPAVAAFSAPANAAVIVTMQVPTVYVQLGGTPQTYDGNRDDGAYYREERREREERYERERREREERMERYERARDEAIAMRRADDGPGWGRGRGRGWGREDDDR